LAWISNAPDDASLASLGPSAPVRTLSDVIAFNNSHSAVALKSGQVLAVAADALDISPADTARYRADRAKDLDLAKTRGLDVVYAAPGRRGRRSPPPESPPALRSDTVRRR
jgi:hypothetical protein